MRFIEIRNKIRANMKENPEAAGIGTFSIVVQGEEELPLSRKTLQLARTARDRLMTGVRL